MAGASDNAQLNNGAKMLAWLVLQARCSSGPISRAPTSQHPHSLNQGNDAATAAADVSAAAPATPEAQGGAPHPLPSSLPLAPPLSPLLLALLRRGNNLNSADAAALSALSATCSAGEKQDCAFSNNLHVSVHSTRTTAFP